MIACRQTTVLEQNNHRDTVVQIRLARNTNIQQVWWVAVNLRTIVSLVALCIPSICITLALQIFNTNHSSICAVSSQYLLT